MIEGGYMDLTTRPTKTRGGYYTNFPAYIKTVFFSNFTVTADDIRVLTHEAGHFSGLFSRQQPLMDYFWPTMACEIIR